MDWNQLIANLQAAGMTQVEIGAAVKRSQTWVADIVRGRYEDLKWADGQALIALHKQRCGGQKAKRAA